MINRKSLWLLALLCATVLCTATRVKRQGFQLGTTQIPPDQCVTPTGVRGRCISVVQCPHIYRILTTRPIPTSLIDFLRRSVCGRDEFGRPKFCCALQGSATVSFTGIVATTAATTTEPVPTQPRTDPPPPTQPRTDPPPPTQPRTDPPVPTTTPSTTQPPPTDPPSTQPPFTEPPTTSSLPESEEEVATLGSQPFVLSTTPNTFVEATTEIPEGEAPTDTPLDSPEVQPRSVIPTLEECGNSEVTLPRIVGGRNSSQGDWPWMAALGYADGRGVIGFSCGGAVITRRHVLTAAHCVDGLPSLRVVRLGEHIISRTDEAEHEDYSIETRIVHENYDENFRNDIAILVLDRDIEFKKHISPICLPVVHSFNGTVRDAERPFVAGWGALGYNEDSSDILQDVQVEIISTSRCASSYARFRTVSIDERTLCAGWLTGGRDACQGDSGGPLIYPHPFLRKYFSIGVVSLGFRCAEAQFPGIYTRVSHFIPWILENIRES